jgi:hypothetical protein
MNALMQLANFWAIVQLLLALGGLVALLRNRAITPDEESRFCMGVSGVLDASSTNLAHAPLSTAEVVRK